jgi:hypothetical protein
MGKLEAALGTGQRAVAAGDPMIRRVKKPAGRQKAVRLGWAGFGPRQGVNVAPVGPLPRALTLPLRDAFSVLFFVSVGVRGQHSILREPLEPAGVLGNVRAGKTASYPNRPNI